MSSHKLPAPAAEPNTSANRLPGKLSPFQRKALARACVAGTYTRPQIAAMLRVTPPTIDRYLDSDPETQRYIEEYESVVHRGLIDLRFDLLDMAPQAARTIKAELTGPDPRLAHDSAWRVVEALSPKGGFGGSHGRQPGEIEVDPAGRQVVVDAMVGLARVVAEVGGSKAFQGSAMLSIKTGPEALPGPTAGLPGSGNGSKPTIEHPPPDPANDETP